MRCFFKHVWIYITDKSDHQWKECAKCGVIR